jgi:hypothetical protein
MTRFRRFEDAALAGRVKRLQRSELDLQARLNEQIAEADRAGRWAPTDPRCRRLSALLKTVRTERQATEQERERRHDAGRPSVKILDANSRSMQSNDLGSS